MTRSFRADASRQLAHFCVQPAAVLRNYPNGRPARASGLVTHRQRPQTAKGTMFVTLEDDTGTVNAIVWLSVVESERKPLLGAKLLTFFGRWQRQDGESGECGGGAAMHLVVMKAIDHSRLLAGPGHPQAVTFDRATVGAGSQSRARASGRQGRCLRHNLALLR